MANDLLEELILVEISRLQREEFKRQAWYKKRK